MHNNKHGITILISEPALNCADIKRNGKTLLLPHEHDVM